jgi:hypothetical protein
MRAPRPFRPNARPGLIAAALAALALFVQALIPAAAIAHDTAGGGGLTMSICTGEGLKTVTVGGEAPAGKPFMGLHCTACAFANFAAVPEPDLGLSARPVRYAAHRIVFQPERTFAAAQARAPPRPPGQGPPADSTV